VQTGLFAPQLGFPNLQSFLNGPEYEVNGIEFNFVIAPMDGLMVSAAGSYNKGELKNSPQVISNNPTSPTFGDPVTESCLRYVAGSCVFVDGSSAVVSVENLFGTPGTEMANSPSCSSISGRDTSGPGTTTTHLSAPP